MGLTGTDCTLSACGPLRKTWQTIKIQDAGMSDMNFPLVVTVSTKGGKGGRREGREAIVKLSVQWEKLLWPGRDRESVAGQHASLGILKLTKLQTLC